MGTKVSGITYIQSLIQVKLLSCQMCDIKYNSWGMPFFAHEKCNLIFIQDKMSGGFINENPGTQKRGKNPTKLRRNSQIGVLLVTSINTSIEIYGISSSNALLIIRKIIRNFYVNEIKKKLLFLN